ncbi:MAG: hypothetical protein ACLPM8_00100 [Myxococcaceae bacterium]
MELEELQKRWAAQDRKLDELLRMHVRAKELGRARSALQRLKLGLAFELVLNALAVAVLGAFIGQHLSELRFVVPAVVLDVVAVSVLAATVRLCVLASEVDYEAPVTTSQRRLEGLRVLRIRLTKWVLLVSPLLWTPLLITGLRALGVDAYAALGGRYLLVNLLFGVAFLFLMRWAARRWAPRLERSGWGRRWAEALAGTSLTQALGQLASIADFEREGELPA